MEINEEATLFAHINPQALQSDLGPAGPRRIIGVDSSLVWQCKQLLRFFAQLVTTHYSNFSENKNVKTKLREYERISFFHITKANKRCPKIVYLNSAAQECSSH